MKKANARKFLFSVVFGLALLELSLRVYSHVRPSVFAYHPSRYQRFKARPGDLSYGFPINAQGYKDAPFSVEREPNEVRVAAVGDSFVFSMVPVEKSFCSLLEARHPGVNVMNFGIIGTGPEDYVTIVRKDVLPYAPDTIILFIYYGNDFLPRRRKLYEYSAAATVIHHVTKAMMTYGGTQLHQDGTYDDDHAPCRYEDLVVVESKYAETFFVPDEAFQATFERAMHSVDAIRALCDRNGIALRVVAIPDRLQLEPALVGDVCEALGRDASSLALERPGEWLARALSARGVPFVDLSDAFRNEQRQKFIVNDIHTNLLGNAIIAGGLPEPWFRVE